MSKYVREVDSITGLRETPVSDAAAAHVRTPTDQSGIFVPMDADPFGNGDDGANAIQSGDGDWWVRKDYTNKAFSNVLWWGAERDTQTDQRPKIQDALDSGEDIYFPPGDYWINGSEGDPTSKYGGLFPNDNQTLYFAKEARVRILDDGSVDGTDPGFYSGLNFTEVSNVTVYNPWIEGDRDRHTGSIDEFGHLFNFQDGASNITLVNPIGEKGIGDGIRINNKTTPLELTVIGGTFEENRRNGCSVIAADGAKFYSCSFNKTSGVSPQKGVDVEPNGPSFSVKDIVFESCEARDNGLAGFSAAFGLVTDGNGNSVDMDEPVSITFSNCEAKSNQRGFLFESAQNITGILELDSCVSRRAERLGFRWENWEIPTQASNLTVILPNRDNDSNFYRGGALDIRISSEDTVTGQIFIDGYTCIDDGQSWVYNVYNFGNQDNSTLRKVFIDNIRNFGSKDPSAALSGEFGNNRYRGQALDNRGTITKSTSSNGNTTADHGLLGTPIGAVATLDSDSDSPAAYVNVVSFNFSSIEFAVFDEAGNKVPENTSVTIYWKAWANKNSL